VPVRLVIVDDAGEIRRAVRDGLAGTDIEVVGEAVDGLEGVEVTGRLHPDVVLLDMRMPVMDGHQAIPLMREVSPQTRIVAFSATAEGGCDEPIMEVDGRLAKGASLDEIASAIRDAAASRP
jgi:DNA-binding NarL/FixJ family response regulator